MLIVFDDLINEKNPRQEIKCFLELFFELDIYFFNIFYYTTIL